MTRKQIAKLVHEGDYVAEVDIELLYEGDDWSPYLTLEDAYKLDDVRSALQRGDLVTAMRLSRVFELVPVAA
jgi:hypothetical protein